MAEEIVLHSGWLIKYSRIKQEARKRFVLLLDDGHDELKMMYTFKDINPLKDLHSSKSHVDKSQATEVIKLNKCNIYCCVMEYFGELNPAMNNLHFIVNEKFVFQCNTKDEKDDWIAAIIATDNMRQCSKLSQSCMSQIINETTFKRMQRNLNHLLIKCQISKTKTKFVRLQLPHDLHQCNFNRNKEKILQLIQSSIEYNCFTNSGNTSQMELFVIEKRKDDNELIATKWNLLKMMDKATVRNFLRQNQYVFIQIRNQHQRLLNVKDMSNNNANSCFSYKYNDSYICEKGLECEIYIKMKTKYDYTLKNYNHLMSFDHFDNNIENKPKCKYGGECKAFKRMEKTRRNQSDCNKTCVFNDKCHLAIYRHPPRNDRQVRMSQNANKLIMIDKASEIEEPKKINYGINELVMEVYKNGFVSDLFIDDSKWREWHSLFTLLYVVNEKMNSDYHKKLGSPLNRAQMMALVLYTSCDCNYDLSKSQREGNYTKWAVFDALLHMAVFELSQCEKLDNVPLYSGLYNVNADKSVLKQCYLPTYFSTSWNKQVSISFMKDKGMLLEFDKNICNGIVCCTVDWISKFPDECEVLIARTDAYNSTRLDINTVAKNVHQRQLKAIKNNNSIDEDNNNIDHNNNNDQKEEKQSDLKAIDMQIINLSITKDSLNNDEKITKQFMIDWIDLLTYF